MNTPTGPKKAQEAFENSKLVLGEKSTFDAAFPGAECLVKVEESGDGISDWEKGSPRGHKNPGEYINCHNPDCNGGLQIGPIVREMVQKRETVRKGEATCFGQETSQKGRRVYGKCKNYFEYEITITYKP